MEILFIVGSLRKNSFNRQVADAAMKDLQNKADVRFLDWHAVPILNADDIYPFGEQDQILREAILQADALWIFCPEHNGEIPGGLKNVLDIASLSIEQNNYASGSPLKGKPVAISGAGGRRATALARQSLTELLKRCGCKVMPFQAGFALPAASFSTGEWEMSQDDLDLIAKEASEFLTFIEENRN